MKEFMKKLVRASGKTADIFPLTYIITFLLLACGQILGEKLVKSSPLNGLFLNLTGTPEVLRFMNQYAAFIGIWLVFLLVMYGFRNNRPMLKTVGLNKTGNTFKMFGIGLLLGFGANSINVILSILTGDIKLSWGGFNPVLLLMFLVAVTIQSGAEELTTRSYMYQKLRRRYRHPLVAIIGNAAFFTALHGLNPGFSLAAGSQIFIIGIVFSMLVYYYDSLWCAIAFHAAWNFTQNIIYGLPNSGIVSAYSMFNLEAASARNGLFYNVNFGVEGSIGASIVLAAVGVLIYMKNKNKPECTDLWLEAEKEAEAKAAELEARKAAEAAKTAE